MNFKTIFILALKNLKRHYRRTIINILSIGISVGIMFFFIGYYRGTYIIMMRESFIKYQSGHIQINTKKFDDKKIQHYITKDTIMTNYKIFTKEILQIPNVIVVSDRLINYGFLSNGKEKMVVQIIGVDPENEKEISIIPGSIKKGNYLDEQDGIVIGKKVQELFNLNIGDICYIQSQTINNTPNILLLPLVGVYETGFYDLDKNVVFTNLKNANILFYTDNVVNKKIIYLNDIKNTNKVYSQLKNKYYDDKYEINTWEYYGQALLENEKSDGIFYTIFMLILIFISISTIMSTMYMSVFERVREIGTLRSIGWKKNEIFKLFILEALCIGLFGSFLGIIIGGIPTLYLQYVGIEYSKMSEVISIPIFKIISRSELIDIFISFFVGMISTYLGALFPATKASKMLVVEALRTN